MPVFEYTALDAGGEQVSGIVEAESPAAARQKIRGLGHYPVELSDANQKGGFGAHKLNLALWSGLARRVPLMTRQMATLLAAGIPLAPALSALIEQCGERGLKTVLAQLREAVGEGRPLSAALAAHPRLFSPIYVNMVKAGEASGALAPVLAQLAEFGEREQALWGRIRAALLYPLFMAVVAALMLLTLMTVALPRITAVFAESERALPLATRLLMAMSDLLRAHWLPLLLLAIALPFALRRLLQEEGARAAWHRLQLKLPLVGALVKRGAAARFARALSSLLSAGVPLMDALTIVSNLAGNGRIREGIRAAQGELEQGRPLAAHFRTQDWCPPLLAQLMAVGEQSGALDAMLSRAADTLERELESRIMGLSSLIEPVMILCMGGAVAFMVVAVLLPIFEMNQFVG